MHPAMRKRKSFAKAPDFAAKNDAVAMLKGEKKGPSEVDYRPASRESKDRCSECISYKRKGQSESDCDRVVGIVKAEGVCDLFKQGERAATESSTSIVIEITR